MKPTLTVVDGGGKADPDPEALGAITQAALGATEAVKSGGGFFLLAFGDEPEVTYYGDLLELAAAVEEIARDMKRRALGLA